MYTAQILHSVLCNGDALSITALELTDRRLLPPFNIKRPTVYLLNEGSRSWKKNCKPYVESVEIVSIYKTKLPSSICRRHKPL